MKIQTIQIKNFMALENLEIKVGAINRIQGDNGQGKTSVAEAIKYLLGGGKTAFLQREGQEKSMVVGILEDGRQIVRKILPSGATLQLLGPDGKPLPKEAGKPTDLLQSLVSAVALNPMKLVNADDATWIETLLEAFPQEVDAEALDALVDDWRQHVKDPSRITQICDDLEKYLMDLRKDVNGRKRQAEATIAQLQQSLPDEAEAVPAASLAAIEARLAEIQREEANHHQRSTNDELHSLRQSDEKFDEEIRALEAKLAELRNAKAAERRKISGAAETARHEFTKTLQQERATLQVQQAALRQAEKQAAQVANTRAFIAQQQKERDEHDAASESYTSVIEEIRKMRANAIAQIPVRGLEIRENAVYLDGKPRAMANEARRVQAAIQVARHAAGELPIICIDSVDCLSPSGFAAFEQAVQRWTEAEGLQVFYVRASDGPLQVVTDSAAAK